MVGHLSKKKQEFEKTWIVKPMIQFLVFYIQFFLTIQKENLVKKKKKKIIKTDMFIVNAEKKVMLVVCARIFTLRVGILRCV